MGWVYMRDNIVCRRDGDLGGQGRCARQSDRCFSSTLLTHTPSASVCLSGLSSHMEGVQSTKSDNREEAAEGTRDIRFFLHGGGDLGGQGRGLTEAPAGRIMPQSFSNCPPLLLMSFFAQRVGSSSRLSGVPWLNKPQRVESGMSDTLTMVMPNWRPGKDCLARHCTYVRALTRLDTGRTDLLHESLTLLTGLVGACHCTKWRLVALATPSPPPTHPSTHPPNHPPTLQARVGI